MAPRQTRMKAIKLEALVAVEGAEDANIYPALLPTLRLAPILCPDELEPSWKNIVYTAGQQRGLAFSPIGGKDKLHKFLERWRPSLANALRHFVLRGAGEAPLPQRCYLRGGLRMVDFKAPKPLRLIIILEETSKPQSLLEKASDTVAALLEDLASRREFRDRGLKLAAGEPQVRGRYARRTLQLVASGDTVAVVVVHILAAPLDRIVAEAISHENTAIVEESETLCRKHNCGKPSSERYWKCVSHTARLLLTCNCSYREHAAKLREIPANTKIHILEEYGLNILLQ